MTYMSKTVLPLVLVVAFPVIQACSMKAEPLSINEQMTAGQSASLSELSLAQEVGSIDIGEFYSSSTNLDGVMREYRVVELYVAASGRQCREVEVKSFNGGTEIADDVLCQNKSGNWYWPRDVIYK